ncbi:capsular polysaccharide biosynthesis protein Cap8F [Anaerocolumna cellulosilytica]|uniref:Capsular polysaccharide biosynthesis protein Cap8F n=1 Tax=Anaerocolumna cellulosilytica TaxID=433286 RepID=A0A6S6R5G0_9FIRM|nr:NAD-dependent epimerase/dehydratase family protein [Anaerocolumna cellulosilytica]MBB5194102.1 UDP-2-acetamido-2,6-beta-L-arabino-hexul-4-ose reductase [Anaerocolumna cellulosilytica]BCJ94682.1 capsular polysaccharide biosynthesis protein Cap8F [Anaerocolumna cellulosilytica]
MKILVTGSSGFLGKNLIARLEAQKEENHIIYKYDVDTSKEHLNEYAKDCEFVFYFAAIHRPKKEEEFHQINVLLFEDLINLLEKNQNNCPILYTSSIQAVQNTEYAKSKREAEDLLKNHGEKTGSKAIIYRLTNTFGKWAAPNHHSVVATFCNNITRELEIEIDNPGQPMNFYYIDDVIDSFISHLYRDMAPASDGFYHLDKKYLYTTTLKELADKLRAFHDSRLTLTLPDMADSFTKKLYSTYLSYIPIHTFHYPLTMHADDRGSFTEIFKTPERGQFSVNVIKPGIKKGEHYHNTKCEKFLVVSGRALIQFRKIDSEEIMNYYASSEELEVIDIPVGYTHNIMNIGEEDLVTLIWANEVFNKENPDTYPLPVE